MNTTGVKSWGLEVVRGREVGRVFPVAPGPVVLGNAPGPAKGIDLSSQETGSARRMAAEQARLEHANGSVKMVDLESPGGTFVNRQRLLPGQARVLAAGDVIQLGGVQLRLVEGAETTPEVRESPAPPPPRSGPLTATFRLAGGATCRSWDEFLAVSSQNWSALRDEVTSGRLAAFLTAQGFGALRPSEAPTLGADERLDDWLGRIPATRPAAPAFEVHPQTISLRSGGTGGVTRRSVVLTNTGYRLLKTNVRVEGSGAGWLRIPSNFANPFVTAEQTEVPVEIDLPESADVSRVASLTFEGNGGRATVQVKVGPARQGPAVEAGPPSGASSGPFGAFATWPATRRAAAAGVVAVAVRSAIGLGTWLAGPADGGPSLGGSALVLGTLGGVAVAGWVVRKGEAALAPAAAASGGIGGVFLAAVGVGLARSVEPGWGGTLSQGLVGVVLWASAGYLAGRFWPLGGRDGAGAGEEVTP